MPGHVTIETSENESELKALLLSLLRGNESKLLQLPQHILDNRDQFIAAVEDGSMRKRDIVFLVSHVFEHAERMSKAYTDMHHFLAETNHLADPAQLQLVRQDRARLDQVTTTLSFGYSNLAGPEENNLRDAQRILDGPDKPTGHGLS